ncbi:hypothetical protein GCM10022393_24280 [Aquimarina addita]|uniref:DUF1569 domain-containing protein n=1 Tax=Aquimarina addita TaxID=870485 RepID=A0ABP6ULM8_9FLAO
MKNIFDSSVVQEVIKRINTLDSNSTAQWGKMNIGQMLAHCSVTYEMVYEDTYPKPKELKKWMLKKFIKPVVVGEKPYKKNGRTAPQYLITDQKEFEKEKKRLIDFIYKTQELGASHFEGKTSHSFGPLTTKEWNIMFYKHLDHHLQQFGV